MFCTCSLLSNCLFVVSVLNLLIFWSFHSLYPTLVLSSVCLHASTHTHTHTHTHTDIHKDTHIHTHTHTHRHIYTYKPAPMHTAVFPQLQWLSVEHPIEVISEWIMLRACLKPSSEMAVCTVCVWVWVHAASSCPPLLMSLSFYPSLSFTRSFSKIRWSLERCMSLLSSQSSPFSAPPTSSSSFSEYVMFT